MLLTYAIRRVLASVPVLFGVTALTYLLMAVTSQDVVPGLELNPNIRPEDIARIRHNLGLDLPWYERYLNWLGGLAHGDFGRSLVDGSPVLSHILDRLPNTLELTASAMLLGVLIAIPLGLTGALRRGTLVDNLLTGVSVAGVSVPSFWLGLMLILIFSVQLNKMGLPWLPSGGAYSSFDGGDLVDRLKHLVLPSVTLSFGYLAIWSRFVRSGMIEVLSQDYMRTARAKGNNDRRVIYIHGLRNAVIPLVTLIGLELPALVSGGALVEIVYSWPGIGRLALERALQLDYTTVMGITLFAAILVVAGNLLADIGYAILDPRIRYS